MKSKFYWEDDIYAIAEVYVKYQSDVYLRKPGANDAMRKFRSERIEYVQAVEEVSGHWKCNSSLTYSSHSMRNGVPSNGQSLSSSGLSRRVSTPRASMPSACPPIATLL